MQPSLQKKFPCTMTVRVLLGGRVNDEGYCGAKCDGSRRKLLSRVCQWLVFGISDPDGNGGVFPSGQKLANILGVVCVALDDF